MPHVINFLVYGPANCIQKLVAFIQTPSLSNKIKHFNTFEKSVGSAMVRI
jgi:hypothetical protein